MTQIYLIRHGEAEGNVFRRLHGQYDSLLTPRGHRQVQVLRQKFAQIPIDGCFSSDLTRACLTARSIYLPKNLPLHRDARFREVDVGVWEDVPYGYLENFEERGMWEFNHNPPAWVVEGSESYARYTQRFLDGMRAAAEQYDGGTIAIFSHGAVMRGVLMRLFFHDSAQGLPYSDNTGVSKLCYRNGAFEAEFLNDNSHLPEELSTYAVQRWWRETDNRKESAVYFLPLSQQTTPKGLELPPVSEHGSAFAVVLQGRSIGVVSLGEARGAVGQILGMALLPGFEGRYYGDQMLGCAFSHFRKLGCTALHAQAGQYPDDILERYAFDAGGNRSIDPGRFDWNAPYERQEAGLC